MLKFACDAWNLPPSNLLSCNADFPRRERAGVSMPVWKYCLWVGGGLLALLFVVDFYVPKQPPRTEAHRSYSIPIAATPAVSKAVTFSGETRDFGSPPPMVVVDFAAQAYRATQAQTTQAYAQMSSAAAAAQRDVKPAHQKVAKRKINRQRDLAHLPDEWRRDRYNAMAFARPFSW